MSLLTDQQYFLRISHNFENLKQEKDVLWRFRCPICGDSKKDQKKSRAYVYRNSSKDYLSFKCHNCGESITFNTLLKRLYPLVHREYVHAKLSNRRRRIKKVERVSEKAKEKKVSQNPFVPICDLDPSHFAVEYVENRKIPKKEWNRIFFTNETKKSVNRLIPNKFPKEQLDKDYSSLVLPLFSKEGMFGFQIRKFEDYGIRYLTFLIDEEAQRLFGEERVDKSKPFYVVEGPIDSLFLENAIAVCGSDMQRINDENAIFVLDCDSRNPHIVKKMKKLIDSGRKVVILPSEKYSGMDINDIVVQGEDVESLLKKHTYKGLTALTMYNKWRKVDV